MRKILITGGAGFIGSHLAESYLAEGEEIVILDDVSTGSFKNIQPLLENPQTKNRIRFIKDTILNAVELERWIEQVDVVVHLAAAVGVRYIIENPLHSLIVNLNGTESVLRLCDKYSKPVFIASTSEVYGKQTHAPLRETDDSNFGPTSKSRWSYAGGKMMDEFFSLAYHQSEDLRVVVARLFNTVGPRQKGTYGMVIPRFVQQALSGEPLTVYGDGQQTRTFTHVSEVVSCIKALVDSPEAYGKVVNIGGVEEVSILDVAERIIAKTQSDSEIVMIPYDEAYPKDFEDMQRRVPSTERLQSLIGFAPELQLDRILDDVIAHFDMTIPIRKAADKVANR
jgi:UDP-glucose 4-epimerase